MNVKEKLIFSILGLLIGYFFVGYLTWSIKSEDISLIILCMIIFIIINILKLMRYKKKCIKIILIGIVISYLFNSVYLYYDRVKIQFPSKIESNFEENKKDAIILVFPANPPLYQRNNWSQMIYNSCEYSNLQKILFFPFILNKYKDIYKEIGKDPSEELSVDFFEKVKKEDFKNKELYFSFLNHKPILEEQVIKAMQEGAQEIYVVNMLLDQSDQWFQIQERIEKIRFCNYNTEIIYLEPFWKSKELMNSYRKEIRKLTHKSSKQNIGILFVGKGCKRNVQEEYTDSIYQQTLFAKEIKEKLLLDGYDKNNIMISYLNDKKFSIKDVLSQLLEQGITELIIIPIYIPFTSIESKKIIPEIINKMEIPLSMQIKYITHWNLGGEFIQEIKENIKTIENNL
ncbi:hypothetical protein [Garciella nitratireducens]|uniref:hypothetical protein n=1 Tax=Garciella nitratireducens TaxID=218205 RepID=UPI000DEB7273|nr:hypothetical protein [Garciella nitratireducens]RBP45546.1 ferrochelatase [Garciella nitratireducens]